MTFGHVSLKSGGHDEISPCFQCDITNYLKRKLELLGFLKFNIIINPNLEKMGKFCSPFLRAGPYSLHNIVEFDFNEIITCLLFLLDEFCEGGSG